MAEILCVGEPLGEFRATGTRTYEFGLGGDISNVAIAIARSSGRAAVASRIGTDWIGDLFMETWAREQIRVTAVERDAAAPTGAYVIRYDHDGHHFDYLRIGSAASRLQPSDIAAWNIDRAAVLHCSGVSQAISLSATDAVFAAIDRAKQSGVTVSYDPNIRLKLWPVEQARSIVQATLRLADIVLPSRDESLLLFGLSDPDAIVDRYLELGCGIVGLTMGGDGVVIATKNRRELIPPHAIKAIDATGAGDTFDGAFLADYVATGNPFEAARYANAAAALATSRHGAVNSIPTRAEVSGLLGAPAA